MPRSAVLRVALLVPGSFLVWLAAGALVLNLVSLQFLTTSSTAARAEYLSTLAPLFPVFEERFARAAVLEEIRRGEVDSAAAAAEGLRDRVTLHQVAWALYQRGEYDRAIAFSRRAGNASYFENLGRTELESGRPTSARDLAQTALRVDPNSRGALTLLGQAEVVLGNPQAAYEALRRALEAGKFDPYIASRAGLAAHQLGRSEEAVRLLERAEAVAPMDYEVLEFYGQALLGQGDLEAAGSVLERALALRPQSAWAKYHYGIALQRQGHCESARAQWADILRRDPDFGPAATLLDQTRCSG